MKKYKMVDWPAVSAWVTSEIAIGLEASPEFMNADTLRE
jgi:hypothetical protein